MSTQTKRFTFDRRKLTFDPVPTILYYKDTDTDAKLNYDPYFLYKQNYSIPCKCSFCVRKVVVSDNKLIPLSVTDWSWDGCSFVLNK